MFKFLTLRDQIVEEKRKNEALNALNIELENALLELADIVATNAIIIQEVTPNG